MSETPDLFDQLMLKQQDNPYLDEQLEREARKGWGPKRHFLRILGQGNSDKRPVIPPGDPADPNAGVVWRFAPVRSPLDPPGESWEHGLGIFCIPAYIHWIEVEPNAWRKTVCSGDADAMDAGRLVFDPDHCPSCDFALKRATEAGFAIDRQTPGSPKLNRYFLGFNESALETDKKAWLEEGIEQGKPRDLDDFIQPLWLLEVASGPLYRKIKDQNRDQECGRVTNYRVRFFKTKTGRGGQWEYHLRPSIADIRSGYVKFTPAQHKALMQYNVGVERDGEIVALPDLTFDCYPTDPEDQKRILASGAGQKAREEEVTRQFQENPVAVAERREHLAVPAARRPSPVAAGMGAPASTGEVIW